MKTNRRADFLSLLLMVSILLATSALFLMRGPWRALHTGGGDFAAPYVASVKFTHGLNPYSHADFLEFWHARGARIDAVMDASGQRPVYPPSTLILMFVFSLLTWTHALAIYVFLCTLLFGFLLYLLAKQIGDKWNSWPRVGFLAYGLSMAPIHTGIGVGNLSIIAFLLCMYSLMLAHCRKNVTPGVLLALAFCIKPTVGLLVLVYMLFCKRWKLLSIGIGLTSLITAGAMVRMSQLPPLWRADYKENVAYLFGPNGAANFTSSNSTCFDLINLQMPFFQLLHNTKYANYLSWLVVALLSITWLFLFLRHRNLQRQWGMTAVLLLLGLLPIYQRNYNAGFVLVALLWAFQNYRLPSAKWIMLLGTIFLIPGEAVLRKLGSHFPQVLTHSVLWNFAFMPQATWGILLIAMIILGTMATPTKCTSTV